MQTWTGRRVLVVVAHPDDETFGCGSLIAHLADAGAEVTVCCATRGEAGEVTSEVELPPGGLAELRERELHEAAAVLGAKRVVLLSFADSDMTGEAGPHTLAGAPLEAVVDAVRDVVEQVAPDVVVTLDPIASDGHRDHIRIGEATTEALQHAPGTSLYYWCVMRSVLLRWLRELHESRPDAGHLELDESTMGRPDDEITTVLDVSAQRERRRRAIAVHASQRAPFEDMPPEVAEEFLCTDRLVRVLPPWTGGQVERELLVPPR